MASPEMILPRLDTQRWATLTLRLNSPDADRECCSGIVVGADAFHCRANSSRPPGRLATVLYLNIFYKTQLLRQCYKLVGARSLQLLDRCLKERTDTVPSNTVWYAHSERDKPDFNSLYVYGM